MAFGSDIPLLQQHHPEQREDSPPPSYQESMMAKTLTEWMLDFWQLLPEVLDVCPPHVLQTPMIAFATAVAASDRSTDSIKNAALVLLALTWVFSVIVYAGRSRNGWLAKLFWLALISIICTSTTSLLLRAPELAKEPGCPPCNCIFNHAKRELPVSIQGPYQLAGLVMGGEQHDEP